MPLNYTKTQLAVLEALSLAPGTWQGAFSVRIDGQNVQIGTTPGVRIEPKADRPGIDVYVSAAAKSATLHLPVILSKGGLKDQIYNDFYLAPGAEISILAGCGIHSTVAHATRHDGLHNFHLARGSTLYYSERHYGAGTGTGQRTINPTTTLTMAKNSTATLEMVQIKGLSDTLRTAHCALAADAKLTISERIMTAAHQKATSHYEINLLGKNSAASLASRAVAGGHSCQEFYSTLTGDTDCTGRSECSALLMDKAVVKAVPDLTARHLGATLVHEAAIGRIARDQITKLMTLGLSRQDAESTIIQGFLR